MISIVIFHLCLCLNQIWNDKAARIRVVGWQWSDFFFLYCSNPPPPTITFFPLNLSPTTCLDSGGLESNSLRLPVFDLNLTGTHSNSSERDIHRECVCERDRKEIRVIQNWREESWVRVAESHQCMFSVCVCVCGNQNISVLKMKLWKYKKQIMGVPCYYWCTS